MSGDERGPESFVDSRGAVQHRVYARLILSLIPNE